MVSKEDSFATDEHGITRKRRIKSEPEASATVSKEDAFATDECCEAPFRHFRECGNPY
jgi:hypothetical protein